LLFKLVRFLNPPDIVEIGTSLGISALSMAMAAPFAKVFTIEGSEEVADVAEENMERMGVKNVEVIRGAFSEQLPAVLNRVNGCSFAYIDGNHRYEPTLSYYRKIVSSLAGEAVILLDDIYWSREMMEAWKEIIYDGKPKVTIDIYHKGIVVFRDGLTPQHFKLRY
jgi:predicted O-methyltransferase YrrM